MLDVNDNEPQFVGAPYSFSLTDSNIRDYINVIDDISANDMDQGANGQIRFSIDGIVRNGMETIVTIRATDQGSPSQSTTAELTVTYERSCLLQEYSINAVSGIVTVDVLCEIGITPEEANVTLGDNHVLTCSALRNGPTTFEWIQNGNSITLPATLAQTSQSVQLTLSTVRFDDAGDYACKVTTQAGSLQTSTSSVNIHGEKILRS